MEDIDFTIDETDPEVQQGSGNFTVLKAHYLLQKYLKSSDLSSITHTAAEIHNMLCVQNADPNGDDSNAEWEHTMFTHTLLDLVGKIPHSHPAQDDIIRLLVRLKTSTKLNIAVNDPEYEWQFYVGLTYFYRAFRERCCDARFDPSTSEETQFINESAFLARLSAAHMYSDASVAVTGLCQTLETEDASENPRYNGFIAAASMWIIHAGQWIFAEVVRSPRGTSKGDEGIWSNGPLYTGSVQGIERWKFWRKALEDSQANVQISSESRALAGKAKDFMDAVERLNTY
ncbi:hypothetical protein MYU51_001913 [Penicillium brevicompactum]|uniref:uncharacterized protein n=1 Tax=Penicillium brevicompactum TaxID=5074 RepID=UPI00253FA692|nr:uncharacterized protein N7506_009755 [Penicillium brevicompactum]KAJ5326653.1 hypothetical protein N7506_009755 [Penicillium brevicompactum]